MPPPEIILVGERDPAKRAHAGIEASLALFQRDIDSTLTFRWVPTATLSAATVANVLSSASGVWCVSGSPYESTEGALHAIRFAREQRRAFLGTCGGFQHALMEFSQNVLGRDAAHAEMDAAALDPLIVQLTCSLSGARAKIIAPPDSWYARILGAAESMEEFNCNYGLAPAFVPIFADSDLEFVAHDEAGQVRAFRLNKHPFFAGTLFQPERRAFTGSLHPLVRTFFENACARDVSVKRACVIEVSPAVENDALNRLFANAWPAHVTRDMRPLLQRALFHVCAYEGARLVGFAKVVDDGGCHGFLLDPTVASDRQRNGIGRQLVQRCVEEARRRGLEWLHVDYEPHLKAFYLACGFRATEAGLLNLK